MTYQVLRNWHPGMSAHGAAQDLDVRINVATQRTANGVSLADLHANVVVHWSAFGLEAEPASDEAVAAAQPTP